MIFNEMLNYLPTDIDKEDWNENPNIVSYRDESYVVDHPIVSPKMVWQEYTKTPSDLIWPILKTIMKGSLLVLYAAWVILLVTGLFRVDYSSDNAIGMLVIFVVTLSIGCSFTKMTFWEPPYIILWEYIDNEFIAHRYKVNFGEIKRATAFLQDQVNGWAHKFIVAYINGQATVYAQGMSSSDDETFDFKEWDTDMLFLDRFALETYMLNEPKQRLESAIRLYENKLSGRGEE